MSGHTSSDVGAVAVLSDVHGVLPVLEAVLAEPDVVGADLVVVTGDHAAGPQPVEVLDRLRSLGERVVLVRGNADRELVALARGGTTDIPDPVAPWAAARLRPDDVALLDGLPYPVERTVRGFGRVVFCHGTPRDDDEVVLVDSSLERWAEVLGGLDDDVTTVVMGHTHMPFARLVDRRLCVNPGSVGMPYGRAGGSWALLRDGQVELRHTPVDVEAAVAAVAAGSTYPGAEEWARAYVTSANSDADALRVFGPRDGRLAVSVARRSVPSMADTGTEVLFADAAAWRAWLDENEETSDGVWLILARKGKDAPTSLTYDAALDEALCSGWIDAQGRSRDDVTSLQRFCPRRSRSRWSARNVRIVDRLVTDGRMRPRGQQEVDRAKADGRWDVAYEGSKNIEVPPDLAEALAASPRATAMFGILTAQNRFAILLRITGVKKPETRARNITKFVGMLERGETVYPQKRTLEG